MSPLGKFVRHRRKQLGLFQEELAKRLGIDDTYVSAIETGKRTPDKAEFLGALCRALELDNEQAAELAYAAQASQLVLRLPQGTLARKQEVLKALANDATLTATDIEAIAALHTVIARTRQSAVINLQPINQGGGAM